MVYTESKKQPSLETVQLSGKKEMKGIKNILTLRALSAKKLSNEYLLIYDATLIFFYDSHTGKNYDGITK